MANKKSNKLFTRKSEVKNIIPLLSLGGAIILSNSAFAASPAETTETEKKAWKPFLLLPLPLHVQMNSLPLPNKSPS